MSGIFILVRTSNAGSADLQQQEIHGGPVWAHIAAGLSEAVTEQTDPSCDLSSIGIVMGATGPEDALSVRQLLPTAPFLIPGYGAQGAMSCGALAGWPESGSPDRCLQRRASQCIKDHHPRRGRTARNYYN